MVAKHTKAQHRAFARELANVIAEGFPLRDKASAAKGIPLATGELARRMGTTPSTVIKRIRAARDIGLGDIIDNAEARRKANLRQPIRIKPVNAEARRSRVVLLTAAQDETDLHEGFWQNFHAYADHRKAEVMVGGFTYQKGLFEDHSVKRGVYDQRVVPFLRPVETRLGPNVIWAGQANILPTAAHPLTGWQTHGGSSSIVLPHAKIALETVPVMPGGLPKIAVSTGVCTVPNYIRRNAGMKAEWHHTIGFVIVEIASDGTHWIRTVSAEKDGSFCDLDWQVSGGKVKRSAPVEAITWGDTHAEEVSPIMARMNWGLSPEGKRLGGTAKSIIDTLKPKLQFHHDLLSFIGRSHHNRYDPAFLAWAHNRADSVVDEIARAAAILKGSMRKGTGTVVIRSNHDNALERWLSSRDGAMDPANSALWHRLNAIWHDAAKQGRRMSMFEYVLREALPNEDFRFVDAQQSFEICAPHAPIECGLHGHNGPNGSRGGPASFSRIVPRVNAGHTHRPCIREGYYSAGTNGNMVPPWMDGPTGWAPADIITHASGKRQILIKNEKGWRL